jgi:hypothetical protein
VDFWQFVGGYWWLVFPLGGGIAAAARGISSGWEKGAAERHARRLEILQAKRGLIPPGAPAAQASPAVTATPSEDRLARAMADHDAITARWLEYELDVAKMIAFPAMSDGRQPLTAAFLRAKKIADRLRPDPATGVPSPERLSEYVNAVTDYDVAFDLAERDARRIKDSSFSAAERKRLNTAQQLLTVAVDEAATPAERQLAYKRVREELDGLISLSDDAIDVLEQKVALQLPAPPTTPPAPGAPPVSGA